MNYARRHPTHKNCECAIILKVCCGLLQQVAAITIFVNSQQPYCGTRLRNVRCGMRVPQTQFFCIKCWLIDALIFPPYTGITYFLYRNQNYSLHTNAQNVSTSAVSLVPRLHPSDVPNASAHKTQTLLPYSQALCAVAI